LVGLDRLQERGYFINPQTSQDAIQQLEDLSSPISAFLRDRCVIDPKQRVEVDAMWAAWKTWCTDENRLPGTKSTLGRDLNAALPTIRRTRPREGSEREYYYQGIGLQ
jgi:putative DNA primase/helicase